MPNNKIIDDHSCIVRVHVASYWLATQVPFHAVSSVKEFANISAYVMLQHKAAPWVDANELSNVQNVTIEKNQLFTLSDSIIEFLFGNLGLMNV